MQIVVGQILTAIRVESGGSSLADVVTPLPETAGGLVNYFAVSSTAMTRAGLATVRLGGTAPLLGPNVSSPQPLVAHITCPLLADRKAFVWA